MDPLKHPFNFKDAKIEKRKIKLRFGVIYSFWLNLVEIWSSVPTKPTLQKYYQWGIGNNVT